MIDLPIYNLGETLPEPKHVGDYVLREVSPPSWSVPGWVVQESMPVLGSDKISWCVVGIGCTQAEAMMTAGLVPKPLRKAKLNPHAPRTR